MISRRELLQLLGVTATSFVLPESTLPSPPAIAIDPVINQVPGIQPQEVIVASLAGYTDFVTSTGPANMENHDHGPPIS